MVSSNRRSSIGLATAVTLGSIGALHALWGRGSTFPFRDRHHLNDHVVGQQVSPSPTACNAVAGLLVVAAVSIERAARRGSIAARIAAGGCGLVLVIRAALGLAGRTDLAVPGSTSPTFRRNDRLIFGPLCGLLGLGATTAAFRAHGWQA